MEIILIITIIILAILFVLYYLKQERLNRLLLHIFYSLDYKEKEYILDHMYYIDALNLKKDMRKMINCDIDLSELEKVLKEQKKGK